MTTTPEPTALPGDLTDYQHELVLNALDRLANQAIAAAGATVLVPRKSDSYQALRDATAGDAELVRAALAAAPVAPSPALTDETIERAAKAIWATRYPESRPDIAESTWAEVTAPDDWMPEALDVMEEARVALAAARVAPVTPSGAGALRQLGCMIVNCIGCGNAAIGKIGDTVGGARCEGCAYDAGKRDRPAPSPDREKPDVFDELRNLLGTYIYPSIIDTGRGDINDAQTATTELAEAVLALFAVPPVVNGAKLAEAIGARLSWPSLHWGLRSPEMHAAVAKYLVERQHEWLGGAA